MQKKDERNKFNFLIFFLHSAFGIGILLLSLLLFSSLILSELISANTMTAAACFSVFLSSFTASTASAVKFGKRLITALLQGLFLFSILYLTGAVACGKVVPSAVISWIPVSCFSGSLAGAVVSSFFKSRK